MTYQERVLLQIINAILETVAEFPDGAPAGPMYMALNSRGLTLDQFQTIMNALVERGKLRREGDLYFPPKNEE